MKEKLETTLMNSFKRKENKESMSCKQPSQDYLIDYGQTKEEAAQNS